MMNLFFISNHFQEYLSDIISDGYNSFKKSSNIRCNKYYDRNFFLKKKHDS